MIFPNLVYKSPGTHQCPGGTFDYAQVRDMEELAKVADDYYPTIELALAKPADFNWDAYAEANGWLTAADEDGPVIDDSDEPVIDDSDEPPTREELEAKAMELGIRFQSNTKNETLLSKIEDVLAKAGD